MVTKTYLAARDFGIIVVASNSDCHRDHQHKLVDQGVNTEVLMVVPVIPTH